MRERLRLPLNPWRDRKPTIPTLLVLALLTAAAPIGWASEASPEPPAPEAGRRRVIAGRPDYDRSGYFKWHFGEGYRKLWTAPFDAKVLDLRTYAGGLTPVRQVGSMQSIGLALKGADGRSYTFRTLDKDPTRILPEQWRKSFPAPIFQDQTIANYPGGALMVPPLAEAAGVPHTEPLIVFMPDDPALGQFREIFGGKPGTIDEYPRPRPAEPGFHGAIEIVSSGKLWERWQNGEVASMPGRFCAPACSTSSSATGTATTGRCASCAGPGTRAWLALPEDRDQAFSNFSGVMLGMARRTMPRLLEWDDDYENMRGLIFQGAELDRWLLTGSSAPPSRGGARHQSRLTDPAIEEAVRRLPPEWYALGGRTRPRPEAPP